MLLEIRNRIKDKGAHRRPDVKKWDIGMGKGLSGDTITSLGKVMTTELNGRAVEADAWNEIFDLPFTKNIKINYTYYTTTNGTDTITPRIDYSEPGDPKSVDGSILYNLVEVLSGDSLAQHGRLKPGKMKIQLVANCSISFNDLAKRVRGLGILVGWRRQPDDVAAPSRQNSIISAAARGSLVRRGSGPPRMARATIESRAHEWLRSIGLAAL